MAVRKRCRTGCGGSAARGTVQMVDGNLIDLSSLIRLLQKVQPDEIYNLAAQSFVRMSWDQPLLTTHVTAIGTANMLEAVRIASPAARYFQASSSEMFGRAETPAQNEATHYHPRSPYASAKVFAHCLVQNYRDAFGLFGCNGIMFNHDSPLRGIEFVLRKITDGAARISLGLATELPMGNLEARRDFGHARDYVRAMWLMLQQDKADDYVVATGRAASIRDLCRIAFAHVGLDYQAHVRVDAAFLRPADVDVTIGDASRGAAAARLGAGDQPRGDDRRDGRDRPRALEGPRVTARAAAGRHRRAGGWPRGDKDSAALYGDAGPDHATGSMVEDCREHRAA